MSQMRITSRSQAKERWLLRLAGVVLVIACLAAWRAPSTAVAGPQWMPNIPANYSHQYAAGAVLSVPAA